MFRNFHIKVLSFFLAVLFWMFVVSLENTFVKFPAEIPVRPVNMAEKLELSGELPAVRLTLKLEDPSLSRTLAASDFDATVDLSNAGAGKNRLPVVVESRNPKVSVVRIEPSEISVNVEPVREKIVSLTAEIRGNPAQGFVLESVVLSRKSITVSGAESELKKIAYAKAEVVLDGSERESFERKVVVKVYGRDGILLSGLQIQTEDVTATLKISQEPAPPEPQAETPKQPENPLTPAEQKPAETPTSGAAAAEKPAAP